MFSPLTWIIVLVLTGLLFRKNKCFRDWCYGLAAFVIIVFSSPAIYNWYARWYQPEPAKLPVGAGYDFGIVAGGFGSVDADGNGYFNSASDRFLQAVKLYKEGIIKNILISGGNSRKKDKSFSEAQWARKEMVVFGVPDSVIFVEDRSAATKENAVNSRRILDSLNVKTPCVLITSAFHMPRAQKLFEQQNMEVIAWPCNYTEGRGPFTLSDLIPRFSLLGDWSRYLKETAWMLVKG